MSWKVVVVILAAATVQRSVTAVSISTEDTCTEPTACYDRFADCATLKKNNGCEDVNNKRVRLGCQFTCGTCGKERVCAKDEKESMLFSNPEKLNKMFHGMKAKHSKYNVKVLSSDPWLVQFDNLISLKEISEIYEFAENWGPSNDSKFFDIAPCNLQCDESDPMTLIKERVSGIVGGKLDNFEYAKLLRYRPTHYENFPEHGEGGIPRMVHDNQLQHGASLAGVRVMTFLIFLSNVEEGGDIYFPNIKTSVSPKRGRGVLWLNTELYKLSKNDYRLAYENQPVVKGEKSVLKFYIHQYDWKLPLDLACLQHQQY